MKRSCTTCSAVHFLCAACVAAVRTRGSSQGAAFLVDATVNDGADVPSYTQQEAKNKEDFVRRCTVAMTMRDGRLTPWRQVEELCASTDRVSECQDEVTERFRTARLTGRSMSPVCEAAYGWFQDNYGMLCPHQCQKLQCRPTCQWLEAKKLLDRTEADLATLRELQENRSREVLELKELVEQRGRDIENLEKKLKQAKIEGSKANDSLIELVEAVNAAKAEEAKARNATVFQEAELEELKDILANASDAQALQERKVSTEEMKAKLQASRVQRLREELAETDEGMQKKQQLIKETSVKVRQENSTAKDLEKQVDAARKRLEEHKATMAGAEKALEQAERMQAKAKGDGALEEDLVAQKREALEEARSDLARLERELLKAKADLKFARLGIRQDEAEMEELMSEVKASNAIKVILEANMIEEQSASDKIAERVRVAEQGVNEAKEVVVKSDLAVKKKEASLEALYGVVSEKKELVRQAAEAMGAARRVAVLDQFGYQKDEEDIAKVVKERDMLMKQLNETEQNGQEASKELDARLVEHREAIEDLQKQKPMVAKQHGLGLLELLGY